MIDVSVARAEIKRREAEQDARNLARYYDAQDFERIMARIVENYRPARI